MENKSPLQNITVEKTIEIVHDALINKGYDPISQFAGYILSEDPLYIPDWENARGVIAHVDRDELLKLLKSLGTTQKQAKSVMIVGAGRTCFYLARTDKQYG